MNIETANEIGKTFLIDIFQRMNERRDWGNIFEDYVDDEYTFQEILYKDFDGNMDNCLELFFKRTVNARLFSEWIFQKGYFHEFDENGYCINFEEHHNDYVFVCNEFDKYINECSVDDLKQILGLEVMIK